MQVLLLALLKLFSEAFQSVFTLAFKNETLWINLLMENQFKKLLEKTNAQKEQKDPLSKTFEGALFSGGEWFLHSEEIEIQFTVSDGRAQMAETVNSHSQLKPLPSTETVIRNSEPKPPTANPQLQQPTVYTNCLSEVLFLGDSYNGEGEDLLGKMISAMKLKDNEFSRYPLESALEDVEDLAGNLENPSPETAKLLAVIAEKRPKVVVSLGATITNILLGKREKLSGIHGQFFEKKTGDCNYSLMPIFHPDFLIINPNMKRTAWIDLQKVMERVGKI
jgi:hypothetical protein